MRIFILTGTSGTGTSGTGTGGTGTGTSGGGFSGTGTGGSGTGSGSGTGGIGVVTAQPGGFTGVSEYIKVAGDLCKYTKNIILAYKAWIADLDICKC